MSSYPEITDAIGAPRPYLGDLKVQYLEEHGVMPAEELTRELLDKYWESNPPRQEGSFHSSPYNIDHPQQQQQQHHHHHLSQPHNDEDSASGDGHLKLVQRRLDLAPFLGSSPAKTYSSPSCVSQRSAVGGYVSAPPARPVAPTALTEPSFDLTAGVAKYGDPFTRGTIPVHDNGTRVVNDAAPVPDYKVPVMNHAAAAALPNHEDPFITKVLSDIVQAAPAQAENGEASASHRKAAAVLPSARRPQKVKDPWTKTEIDRVVFLREKQNKNWEEIHQDLGTHTPKSIGDKYWQVVRLSKGLKK